MGLTGVAAADIDASEAGAAGVTIDDELLLGLFGAILPGAAPGDEAVTSGALTAPFGAGVGVWVDAPLAGAIVLAELLPAELEAAGAILPGEVFDGLTFGAFTAPVGAGAGVWVWAQAMPVVISKAVDANHNDRIIFS